MSDVILAKAGRAGRITLNRPEALNALTHEMCLAIEAALDDWADDPDVALVLIEGAGERAFSAGGDIAVMYETGTSGDYSYGRKFWSDEYRLNAKIAKYSKPYIAFMHGFVMGGGAGVSIHASHRVVTESTRVAMPECGIGLVPDVGSTHLLAAAPGALGAYLGTTGTRMGPGDAIYAGFADSFVPAGAWDALKLRLIETGDPAEIAKAAAPSPEASLAKDQAAIDAAFTARDHKALLANLAATDTDWARKTAETLARQSPLSAACTLQLVARAKTGGRIEAALAQEYRFVSRCMELGDFLEGIRAQIIDKDRNPKWRHPALGDVTQSDVEAMLAPLGANDLIL